MPSLEPFPPLMAVLSHLLNPSLFAARELHSVPSVSRLAEERLRWGNPRSPCCRALLFSCSAKKSRANRKSRVTKSTADLYNELREFVVAVGLPEHHVPSTKELLEHGRKDLAYIVRRRGNKEITKLLMNPTNGSTMRERDLSNDSDFGNVSTQESIEGQDTQGNMYSMPADGAFLPSCSSIGEKSLHEGVTSHSQNGELEIIGDCLESVDTLIYNDYKSSSSIHNADSADEGSMGSQLSFALAEGRYSSRDDASLEEILGSSDFDENKASVLAEKANQGEINRLKEMLLQKERELALLKQQIEEEKFALSIMQSKAQSEISKVQDIISTKDKELREAEESLSGLKEVLIEYWGNGDTVEVAGSFNGWQHCIKMDPHTSSKTANLNGREGIMWSTILWLYPGIYEIKYVVDGHWKIDPRREFVTVGNITNNILTVER